MMYPVETGESVIVNAEALRMILGDFLYREDLTAEISEAIRTLENALGEE